MEDKGKSIKVSSIVKRFAGDFLNKNDRSSERRITMPGFTRLGMELNGIFLNTDITSIVCWGRQESVFLDLFDDGKKSAILRKILERNPPMFLLSKHFRYCDLLCQLNKEVNYDRSAVVKVDLTTSEIYPLIGTWLSKSLAKWSTIHGTVLSVWGEGVLIIGEPGVGKSEAASALIRMNHLFLGDDAINVSRLGTIIMAKPHPISKGFIHLRGLGILNIKEMYGTMKVVDETKISMVIELRHNPVNKGFSDFENIGEDIKYYYLLGVKIPHYILPVTTGRNISELIELAVIDLKLKTQGYNSAKEMNNRYKELTSRSESDE